MPIHHDRRRRVLTDELSSNANVVPVPSTSNAAANATKEAYAAAARREHQPHVTDLVPTTWLALALPLLAATTVIVGLELAYTWLPELTAALGASNLSALDLASAGSLAHWYSAALLGLTAILAVLVYRLRSHRIDDYRGRYRMWLWVVPAALGLSINETAHLDRLGESILQFSLRGSSLAPGSVWSIGCAVLWGLIAVRVVVEVRHSLLATAVLVLAAVDLSCVATVHLWPIDLSATRAVMLLAGLRMAGHLLVLTGITLFARHVILDAEGRLKKRANKKAKPAKRKRRVKSSEEDSNESGKKTTKPAVDSPHKAPSAPHRTDLDSAPRPDAPATARPNFTRPDPPAERKPAAQTTSPQRPADDEDDDGDDIGNGSGMTRAERKRLKRMQK